MKVCLVVPPVYNSDEGILPPLGILSIAAYLENNSIDVIVVDYAYKLYNGELDVGDDLYSFCAFQLINYNADIIGINTQNMTLPAAINIAREIKAADPNVFVILGGPGSDTIGKELLEEFSFIDFIIQGEGEQTLLALCNNIKLNNFYEVSGLIWRDTNKSVIVNEKRKLIICLDSLPKPAYHLIDSPKEYSRVSGLNEITLNVELARGCNFACTFCGCASFWNNKRRTFDIDGVINQIKVNVERYGVTHITLSDDNFLINRRFCYEFLRKLIDARLNINWDTRGRLDCLDRDLLEELHVSGCNMILIGVESASNEILNAMNKRITSKDQLAGIMKVVDAGIVPILSFVIGHPNETREQVNETLSFIIKAFRHSKRIAAHLHILNLIPGTDMYKQYCRDLDINAKYYRNMYHVSISKSINRNDLKIIEAYPYLMSSYYNVKIKSMTIEELEIVSRLFVQLATYYTFTLSLLEILSLVDLSDLTNNYYKYMQKKDINILVLDRFEIVRTALPLFCEYIKTYENEKYGLLFQQMALYESSVLSFVNDSITEKRFILDIDVVALKGSILNGKYISPENYQKKNTIILRKVNSKIQVSTIVEAGV